MSGYFRKKPSFAQVSNSIIRNESLSLKAKGLYSVIQSYITMDNFTLYKDYLLAKSTDGKKSFQTAWDELKKAGYLKQYRIRMPCGYIYEYELLDEPNDTPALVNIGLNGEVIEPPQKGVGSVEPPRNGVGPNRSGFEPDMVRDMGDNNNTGLSNTVSSNTIISQSEYDDLTDGQTPQFIAIVDAVIEHATRHQIKTVTPETIVEFFDYWQTVEKGKIKNVEKYLKATIDSFFRYRL